MRKTFLMMALGVSLASSAVAQDLDTVTVVDQLSSGSRSDQANGAVYSSPTYPEITGAINYYTTFESGAAAETPVLDVTQVQALDGVASIPAVADNSADTFSTSPSFAAYVGDGGGGQNLLFGQENSANYFVRAATHVRPTTIGAGEFERVYIAARVPALSGATFNTSSNTDAIGGYGLYWESDTATFLAVIIHPDRVSSDLSGSAAQAKDAVARTVVAESAPVATAGWHILEIECFDSTITYRVDGVELAVLTDSKYAAGLASLSYREIFSSNQNEEQGKFDWVEAGPATAPPPPTSADFWALYH